MTASHPHNKANAAVLVGAWQVLFHELTATQAYSALKAAEPFQPFRDASCGPSQFSLTVLHVLHVRPPCTTCHSPFLARVPSRMRLPSHAPAHLCTFLQGIQRARDVGIMDWANPRTPFDLRKYEHYEQVINGDLNWILPGRFIAVSGPTCRKREHSVYGTLGCEDYVDIFREEGVSAVMRLNKPVRASPPPSATASQVCTRSRSGACAHREALLLARRSRSGGTSSN